MPVSTFQYGEMLARLENSTRSRNHPSVRGDAVERESDLHDEIIKFCRVQPQPWVCLHSRMDQRATNNLGTTDFIIVTHTGKVWFIEAKRKGGKLRPAQNAMLAWLTKNGANAAVVFSKDEFKSLVL